MKKFDCAWARLTKKARKGASDFILSRNRLCLPSDVGSGACIGLDGDIDVGRENSTQHHIITTRSIQGKKKSMLAYVRGGLCLLGGSRSLPRGILRLFNRPTAGDGI
jgi:hypothetical protein